jgi:tetratricopeptide (TPR) repeat protein
MIQAPEASDYNITMLEDLRNLIFEIGSDPVAATNRRTDLHWARALELFGPRIDRALSLFEQYQTSADLDLLGQAQRRWDSLVADPRLTSAPPGFQLYVSDGVTVCQLTRYAVLGNQNDLEAALEALREALDNTADTSRLRPRRLTNYATALLQRFHVTEDTADLRDGLEASRQALAATDRTDPLWPGRANNLAAALSTRSARSPALADLDDAVRVYDEALALAPEQSPARAKLLHGKGSTLQRRHAMDDDIGALEASIRYFGEAVDISEGLPERALFLGDLGIVLGIRFEEVGDVSDLDRSIDRLSEAVEYAAAGRELIRRNSGALAIACRTRYERCGALDDLGRATGALRTAWQLTDPADAGYSDALETYGTCLERFVNALTSALENTETRELRSQLGQALWELYEITRSETVRDRALEHIRAADENLPGMEDPYCNTALRLIDEVSEAMLRLYGRDLYNTFSRLGGFLQEELYSLINDGCMDTDLQAKERPDQVLLPGLSPLVARHIRYAWDYFVFIYMSHKIKNIKRRQVAREALDLPILLYLRGADYQLAISQVGAGVGFNTAQDTNFHAAVLSELPHEFDVLQVMSPSNLNLAMKQIGLFLGAQGNYLSSTAEFARAYDAGIFLNPASWRAAVLDLLPSASVVIVYVSNQSNGLMYELESLAAHELEDHAILVLDENRFGSRESFFAMQARLDGLGVHVYESVIREVCAVEEPDVFERLVDRFPHVVTLRDESAACGETSRP